MALLNEIKRMQNEGKTEQEIISSLRKQGVSPKEIVEALSQSKIKKAVAGETPSPEPYPSPSKPAKLAKLAKPTQQTEQEALMPQPTQPTQLAQPMQETYPDKMPQAEQPTEYAPSQPIATEQPATYPAAQPSQPQQAQEAYQEYPQYSQGTGISSDTITEIAEQVVSEKFSTIKKDMESLLDLKNTMGAKISLLDERLKRIESIIDRLNLSIMQKVGDYMANINDIKKELIETQKSFKALAPSLDLGKNKQNKPKKQQTPQTQNNKE